VKLDVQLTIIFLFAYCCNLVHLKIFFEAEMNVSQGDIHALIDYVYGVLIEKGPLKIDNIAEDDQNDIINLMLIFCFSLFNCN
jgi:hypothetical protein